MREMQETDEARGPAAAEERPDPRRWWVLGVLSLALFVIVLNNSLLNVALPSMRRDLGASIGETQWVVDSYALVLAAGLLTAGTLSDRYGRKRATMLGMALYGGGSLIALTAQGTGQLIAARAVMGVAAAMVMPGTLSILVDVFPERERPRAIAVWGSTSALGVAVGPVIGGALAAQLGWGSVFLVNLLPVVVVLTAGVFLLPESAAKVPRPMDPVGAVLGGAAMAGVVFGAIQASSQGWTSPTVLGGFGAALVAGGAFTVWERRHPSPMVDFALLRRPVFLGASAGITLLFSGVAGTLFVLTQYLQFHLGYSPLRAGLAIAPVAVAVGIGSSVSPWLARRTGPRGGVTTGLAVAAAGILTLAANGAYPGMLIGLALLGIGAGVALSPATDTVLRLVPPERAGNASALNDTMLELGNAMGVAVVGSVLAQRAGGPHTAAPSDFGSSAAAGFGAAAAIVATGVVLACVLLPGATRPGRREPGHGGAEADAPEGSGPATRRPTAPRS
ncbi:MFS transporter [Streptomyces sp. SID9727]|uniref:MFS transporter n=1 Tax=Streptomyces sp. SID9727 TaxID=2706114 RepID=UPI001EF33DC3|nr:MFS transporter [Streptomyces sp. SID9727]